ncbi:SpoIIE family protein phosphatase [Pseudonocardia nigra]|uniref:SpoIIE family protein phosphatase n=1 Tax=Pseudonocardia nigra TaxID=1921578 RepID=UPI001C5F033C|nr:SpoIIE family protein phosphatase [Pseudonocardia nigra]
MHGEIVSDPVRLAALAAVLPVARAASAAMDRLAELAATVMDAPIGMVVLVDDRRQHLVGLAGTDVAGSLRREMPIALGYCPATTLAAGKPICIEDAADDPDFADHPAHRELGFVAYAGAPLRDADGQLLGALCVTDTHAHPWRAADRRALEALAESVVSELTVHRDTDRRQRLLDAFDAAPAGIAVTRGPQHVLEYHNAAYRQVFGDLPLELPGRVALPALPGEFFALMDQVLASGETFAATDAALTLVWPGESEPRERFFDFSYSAIGRDGGDDHRGLLIVAVEVTDRVHAHRELQRRARHQELLARASTTLNRNLDPAVELQELARVAVPELADLSTVNVLAHPVPPGVDPPLPVVTDRIAVAGAPGRLQLPEIRLGLQWNGDGDPITETIRRGELLDHPIAPPAPPAWARATGADAAIRDGLHHLVLAPVVVDGLVVAVVTFGVFGGRRPWSSDELGVLREIARYASIALGHGLSYQRTRESALVLQRSLLTEPPSVEGLEICARYRPAGRDEVGGDWYDAFERRPGQLAVVIGDVVGHDITAAAAMAQLRATLRGLALDRGDGPAAALDRLDAINSRLGITAFATLIHGRLTRTDDGWTLHWANAGHPPPVLVTPGTGPQVLMGRAMGAALIRTDAPPRGQGEIGLPRGSTLLLYTDGLVERRDADLADSIDELAARAFHAAHLPLGELCDTLLAAAPTTDDVALLALRATA